jgi:hypothetical protein
MMLCPIFSISLDKAHLMHEGFQKDYYFWVLVVG